MNYCRKCNTRLTPENCYPSLLKETGYAICKECNLKRNALWTKNNIERRREQWKKARRIQWLKGKPQKKAHEIKIKVLAHYANANIPQCLNLFNIHSFPYTNQIALTIDHIQGGGTRARNTTWRHKNIYRQLYKDDYPSGYRTLCMNCNWLAYRLGKTIRKIRLEVIYHYGNCCALCHIKTPELLTIDHTKGGGKKHKRTLGKKDLYYWLRENNYPFGFRVLCWNCQYLERNRLAHTSQSSSE